VSTEGIPPSAAPTLEPVMLEATAGPGAGVKARLDAGSIFVGSEPGESGLRIEDTTVSRQHAAVELLPGAVRVRDLGSTNGTTYLGARISEAMVPLGGSITVGRTTLRFSPVSEAQQPISSREELGGLYGKSVGMRRAFAVIERLAPLRGTVLFRGETGTGKTTGAKALHVLGSKPDAPFQVFDCAAVNPNLLESELFGHAKGAFTGAEKPRAGAVEAAMDGTLLLDEVGELLPELQPKLLRLLDQREFRRVGDGLVRKAQCQFVATTARDLEADVKAGRFRSDLYFRLAAAQVWLPALRERREDIPELARRFAEETSHLKFALSPATLAELQSDQWPGNVRELRNAVERAVTLGAIGEAPEKSKPVNFKAAREKMLLDFERDYLQALLAAHRGNVSAASRESGLSRSQFYRLLEKHRLAAEEQE
jgi:DNA-binding NtrC family response regulator